MSKEKSILHPEEYRILVKESLSEKRYQHSVKVADTAACLAMRYGESIDAALIAGYLHDCAKEIALADALKICEEYKMEVSESEKRNYQILHQKVGRIVAERDYNITDGRILDAIMYHTTGRPDMSLLEKIIFTADFIEPLRNKAKRLDSIRNIAFNDIDKAVRLICLDTIEYLTRTGIDFDKLTLDTCKFYTRE